MEYKKSKPVHGKLDGRYALMYEYEFPRSTRTQGRYLPLGSVRLREFLYGDGGHGQLVQITVVAVERLAKRSEAREMVDKLLDLGREEKKFREGALISQELTGVIREYSARQLVCLDDILVNQEKLRLFASARRVKNREIYQRRARRWKIRLHLMVSVGFFVLGGVCGAWSQKYNLLDLQENAFVQDYILSSIKILNKLLF